MKALVTVIGEDRIGIIHGVATIFKEYSVNIHDVNQTILGGLFTMMMLVDLDNMNVDFKTLKDRLEQTGQDLSVSVRIQREDIFEAMHTI